MTTGVGSMYTRKQYFIKKGLQTRFIWTILLIIFLVFVIISCNLLFFATYLRNELPESDIVKLAEVYRFVMAELYDKLILLGVVNLIIVVVISLFFSHQIAGPIYKIEQTLKRIRDGSLRHRLKFRNTDNLDDLADQFNATLDYLTGPYPKIGESLERIAAETGGKGEAGRLVAALKAEFPLHLAKPEEPAAEAPAAETESAAGDGPTAA